MTSPHVAASQGLAHASGGGEGGGGMGGGEGGGEGGGVGGGSGGSGGSGGIGGGGAHRAESPAKSSSPWVHVVPGAPEASTCRAQPSDAVAFEWRTEHGMSTDESSGLTLGML